MKTAAIFLLMTLMLPAALCADNFTVGRVENVAIEPGGLVLRAKLDTGADRCSLSAEKMEYFQKGRDLWVRFTIRNRTGNQPTMEMQVLKTVKIKRDGGRLEKRPVVRIGICLGTFYMMVDANLTDRSDFAYPMLIGSDYITGHMTVDPARSFTVSPHCNKDAGGKKAKRKSDETKH